MLGRASRRAMCASGGGAAFIHVQNKKLSPIQKVRVGRQRSKSYGAMVLGALAVEHGSVSKERNFISTYITDVRLGVHVLASLQGVAVLDYRAYLHVSSLYPASSVHIVDTVGRGHTRTPEAH